MRLPFKTTVSEGNESIMIVGDINPDKIIFNRVTKEISIECLDTYTDEDLDDMSWQAIKKLVIDNGGEWESKSKGIEYMIGRPK